MSSVEHYPRGYAPKRQIPVLALSQSKRHRTNLISSITNLDTMRFMVCRNTLRAQTLIRFLERLIKDSKRKVFLILDNQRVHHSCKVRQWLDGNVELVEVFFLPGYSPELNPDEYLNADLKAWMSAGVPARRSEQMK